MRQIFVPVKAVIGYNAIVPADLQSAGIKYKDFSIRLLPIFLINRYESRITDPYIFCCRIAYPPEHYSCFFSTILIFDVARTLVLLLLYKEFPTTKNISLIAFMLRDKK